MEAALNPVNVILQMVMLGRAKVEPEAEPKKQNDSSSGEMNPFFHRAMFVPKETQLLFSSTNEMGNVRCAAFFPVRFLSKVCKGNRLLTVKSIEFIKKYNLSGGFPQCWLFFATKIYPEKV